MPITNGQKKVQILVVMLNKQFMVVSKLEFQMLIGTLTGS